MMRRHGGLLVLAVVLVSGCSSGRDAAKPGLVPAWSVSSISPIGQPVAAGGTVVFYGTVGQDLYLYGVGAADGSVLWRQAASPGAGPGGIPLVPAVLDERVVYLRPDPSADLAARLVVASPDTGVDLLTSSPASFVSGPRHCADDKDVCATVANADGTKTSRRFSVDAGGPVADAGAAPAGSRFIGQGLLDLGQRQPEVVARFDNGAVTWRAPLGRYFSAGYSTDQGWDFDLFQSAGLYVGSVGRPADHEDVSTAGVDLSKAQVVAMEAGSGASAWKDDGGRFECDGKIDLDHTLGDGRREPWPIRCRMRGTARYDRVAGTASYDGLDVTVEGFDVATGKTTWSVTLGAAEAFLGEDAVAAPVSDTEVLVPGAAGGVQIDLATGAFRSPAPSESFWCATDTRFEYREPRRPADANRFSSWRGGALFSPCTAGGQPTNALPRQLPASVGVTIGDRTVVASPGGLVAYVRPGR